MLAEFGRRGSSSDTVIGFEIPSSGCVGQAVTDPNAEINRGGTEHLLAYMPNLGRERIPAGGFAI